MENVSADYPFPDNASLLVLDWGGRVIDSVNFSVWFIVFVESLGAVEMDPAPFAFLAPFPPDAAKIFIRYGDTTVEFNPLTKLLHDAVDSIPDYGFINNPEQRRKALHNKIDAVENMLTAGNFKGALEKLKHDIKPTIEKWLKDYDRNPTTTHQTTNPTPNRPNNLADKPTDKITPLFPTPSPPYFHAKPEYSPTPSATLSFCTVIVPSFATFIVHIVTLPPISYQV